MIKMTDKKVLYMNDFPKFRYIAGAIVVLCYIFTQLWNYWLSPLTVYSKQIFEPSLYYLYPIIMSAIFYIAFIALTFIPYDKSWRYMFLAYSALFVIEAIYQFISVYHEYTIFKAYNVEYDVWQNISSRLGFVILYLIIAVIFLLPFFKKRFSKYLAVIALAITLFSGIIVLLDIIKDCLDFYNSETYDGFYYYYYGFLMKGENIDYYLVTRIINSVPVLPIYYFFLSLFISVKKREKAHSSTPDVINVIYTPNNPAVYYPQNSKPMNAQPEQNQPGASFVQPSAEPTVSVNQNSYINQYNTTVEATVSVDCTPEEVAEIVPLAPSYDGAINKKNNEVATPVTPQINQSPQPRGQALPMFCNQCGYKMPNDFAFCPKCGKKFK